jgi:outer membrane lipoprotein SlyB
MRKTAFAILLLAIIAISGCGKSDAPASQATTVRDSHPVKNVEALPSGTIQEGAKTMNSAADLAKTLEQQKQDREKNSENR